MAQTPLIKLLPDQGLTGGLFPSAEPTAGATWNTGENVWFRQLDIRHSLGETQALALAASSKRMAQAFADNERRLYYEVFGKVYKWDGVTQVQIGSLSSSGLYDFEPFGTWLIATDNLSPLKVWKNDSNGFHSIGSDYFARTKIVKKLAQRVLAYSTDALPAGFHYSAVSNAENWTPGPGGDAAGNLPLRDLDSDILAVADLGAHHAVYSASRLTVVQYLGSSLKFGTPSRAISGIGAAGKSCIIPEGSKNYGVFQGGVFVTDGLSYQKLGNPAIDEWLQTNVDWTKGEEVIGWKDERQQLLTWNLPLQGGAYVAMTVDTDGRFSFTEGHFTAAIKREVFANAFISRNAKIYNAAVNNTVLGTMTLSSHLLDGGDQTRFKVWDYAIFEGALSGQVRFGYTDSQVGDNTSWTDWMDLASQMPLIPRESLFLRIELQVPGTIRLCGIQIFGGLGGLNI